MIGKEAFFMSKISKKLSLHIGADISLENFSFSQLVIAVKKMFDSDGIPGFIRTLVILIESILLKSGACCPRCKSEKNHLHGQTGRKIKTSIGIVQLVLSRVICTGCKKTFCPMMRLFDLNHYSRKSREFEKAVLETVTDQSFRRSAKAINEFTGFKTPHTTIHRWFWKTESININHKKRVDNLIADGTGFKKDKDEDGSNRGQIKVIIGYNNDGSVYPYGAWTRASWQDLGNLLKRANHPSDKIKFKPIANTLITDGEEELVRRLKKLANSHQRCLFHMTYELTPLLQYKDNVGKEEALKISERLNELLYTEFPETQTDPLKSLEDKLKIEVHLIKMKKSIDDFITDLKMMGYKKTKTFVENAKNQIFTYIDNWIKTGATNPKVTSLVERVMREIKRRIKRMGYKWSEQGAEKMTRLILLQLSSTKHRWDLYWTQKMGFGGDIKLSFLGVTVD
jgi:transposase-like protein